MIRMIRYDILRYKMKRYDATDTCSTPVVSGSGFSAHFERDFQCHDGFDARCLFFPAYK